MSLGTLFMHSLKRVCASGHHGSMGIRVKFTNSKRSGHFFSTGSVNFVENDEIKLDSSTPNTKMSSRQALVSRRRPLSPLERISNLLPQDSLTPEVEELRVQDQQQPETYTSIQKDHKPFDNTVAHSEEENCGYLGFQQGNEPEEDSILRKCESLAVDKDFTETQLNESYQKQPSLPGETLLSFGEMLVAEYRKKGQVEFRKMFQLQTGVRLQSSWGIIPHDEIAGQPAGSFLKTNRGVPILIRRASLEDYVLYMKRGPAIAYPKVDRVLLSILNLQSTMYLSLHCSSIKTCFYVFLGCSCDAPDDGHHRGRLCT